MDKDIKVFVHPPLEFYYSLVCLAAEKALMEELGDDGIVLEKKYIETMGSIKGNLSKYIWSELKYFFDERVNPIMGIGEVILWGFILNNPGIGNVDELIKYIEKCSIEEFFSNLVEFTFHENMNRRIKEVRDWEKVKTDITLMTEEMKSIDFKDKSRRETIIEAMENAEETRHRFCLLLSQFYERAYRCQEEKIIAFAEECIESYKAMIGKNPTKFLREYTKKDIGVFSDRINIHLSYIWYCGTEYWATGKEVEWLSIGCRTRDFIYEEPRKDRVINFLKKISDRKRIEIIELLSKRDCYVNEIAEELKISAATASYHLATLQDFEVVDFERVEHRFYYHINKERLSELLDEVKEVLLGKYK